jgi:antitoxin (DNA-binding transcriptional repressor) of toxin-antitoxin stability system
MMLCMALGAVKHEVCACELHDQLDRCIDQVAAGDEVVVTRQGRPVALLTQQPRADRPVPTAPVSDLIAEQRR